MSYRFVLSLIAAAALCACTPETTPSPEAPPAAESPPASNALTANGWGPLLIGMSRAEIVAALGPDANPGAVGGADPATCDQFRPQRAPAGMLLMIEHDRLTRISLTRESDIDTSDGFRIGDSASAIKGALGDRVRVEPHKYQAAPAEYLTAWTAPQIEAYVTNTEARGVRYEIGADGNVASIHAGGPSIQLVEGCS